MIKHFSISGFKCFSECTFNFRPLTLLAGINGAGKSSLIQSLLLAKEAMKGTRTIPLDLTFGVNLGVSSDVINWNCIDETIILKLRNEFNDVFECKLKSPNDSALYLDIIDSIKTGDNDFNKGKARFFSYLSAERMSPKAEYKLSSMHINDLEIGIFGENSIQLLEALGSNLITEPDRIHPETPKDEAKFLLYQVERWLCDIVRPLKIKCEKTGSSSTAILQFKMGSNAWVKASNMGFGASYALPIIIAGLTTPKDGLLIIENPEAHLHPAGQSAMGQFIAWLASKGVQIILETHSDHILNGVRIAIASKNSVKSEDTNIIFFDNDNDAQTFQELYINESGGISSWPKTFFDQFQLDTAALGRLRRSKLKNGICN
ncbi:AAA family ATPase [Enterobacter bugandensis]|uniref:AAA family ATPase n=2 Tax=Enterobacter bugandensis TaxID=881260 RepID=UPI002FD7046E